ncbi:flagellar protein FlaG [Pseudomonas sp. Marseille-P8916]|uniref:flagellar protein FlaG n=1 Tax=Pseudomonas sp. Marseille-P8916 TaxID=2866589 RepID=UPI001CE42794|nr:flagellar protein FlaG [Pseudomonas sp. Marseille-P8916]
MDISVKVNQSYPTARLTEPVVEKPVSRSVEAVREGDEVGLSSVEGAEKVKSAVSEIEKFLSSSRRNLEFSMDEESGKIVVKVIASETGELIRQIPSEEALRIASSLSDVSSLLFDAKV